MCFVIYLHYSVHMCDIYDISAYEKWKEVMIHP